MLWKCLKHIYGKVAGSQSATLSKKKLHYKYFSINFCLTFKSICFKENFKEKSNKSEMQCVVCYSRGIAFNFQLLQLVRLTDRWSTFYERMNHLTGQYLLSSAINKKE